MCFIPTLPTSSLTQKRVLNKERNITEVVMAAPLSVDTAEVFSLVLLGREALER